MYREEEQFDLHSSNTNCSQVFPNGLLANGTFAEMPTEITFLSGQHTGQFTTSENICQKMVGF